MGSYIQHFFLSKYSDSCKYLKIIRKQVKNYNWASGSCSILSEFGSFSLEFQYLSDLTENKIFAEKVYTSFVFGSFFNLLKSSYLKIAKIFKTLSEVTLESGLYYNYLSPITAKWCMKQASIGVIFNIYR